MPASEGFGKDNVPVSPCLKQKTSGGHAAAPWQCPLPEHWPGPLLHRPMPFDAVACTNQMTCSFTWTKLRGEEDQREQRRKLAMLSGRKGPRHLPL